MDSCVLVPTAGTSEMLSIMGETKDMRWVSPKIQMPLAVMSRSSKILGVLCTSQKRWYIYPQGCISGRHQEEQERWTEHMEPQYSQFLVSNCLPSQWNPHYSNPLIDPQCFCEVCPTCPHWLPQWVQLQQVHPQKSSCHSSKTCSTSIVMLIDWTRNVYCCNQVLTCILWPNLGSSWQSASIASFPHHFPTRVQLSRRFLITNALLHSAADLIHYSKRCLIWCHIVMHLAVACGPWSWVCSLASQTEAEKVGCK